MFPCFPPPFLAASRSFPFFWFFSRQSFRASFPDFWASLSGRKIFVLSVPPTPLRSSRPDKGLCRQASFFFTCLLGSFPAPFLCRGSGCETGPKGPACSSMFRPDDVFFFLSYDAFWSPLLADSFGPLPRTLTPHVFDFSQVSSAPTERPHQCFLVLAWRAGFLSRYSVRPVVFSHTPSFHTV